MHTAGRLERAHLDVGGERHALPVHLAERPGGVGQLLGPKLAQHAVRAVHQRAQQRGLRRQCVRGWQGDVWGETKGGDDMQRPVANDDAWSRPLTEGGMPMWTRPCSVLLMF